MPGHHARIDGRYLSDVGSITLLSITTMALIMRSGHFIFDTEAAGLTKMPSPSVNELGNLFAVHPLYLAPNWLALDSMITQFQYLIRCSKADIRDKVPKTIPAGMKDVIRRIQTFQAPHIP